MPSAPRALDARPARYDPIVSLAAAAAGGAGGGTFPRARIWPWYIDAALNTRTTRISPAFTGPAMILELMFRYPSANNIRNWALYWATDDGGALTGGNPAIIPNGTPIFEQHTFSSAAGATDPDEIAESFISSSIVADTTFPVVLRPRFLIQTTDRFFLKVTVGGGTAAGGTFRGSVTVVEAPSLDDLRSFS